MEYDFSILLLRFAQAFLARDVEQLKSIATELKSYTSDDEQLGAIIDTITAYVDDPNNEEINLDEVKTIFDNAGITNYESFLYYLQLSGIDTTDMPAEDFKAQPYYQYFLGEQTHINKTVGFNFNNQIAFAAIGIKDSALLQEVLTRIEQLNTPE